MGKVHKEIVQYLVAGLEDVATNGEGPLVKVRLRLWPPVARTRWWLTCGRVRVRAGSDGWFVQGLNQKTKQLLATLDTLADPQTNEITAESIKAKELPTAMARFYFNLAIAEGRASR